MMVSDAVNHTVNSQHSDEYSCVHLYLLTLVLSTSSKFMC